MSIRFYNTPSFLKNRTALKNQLIVLFQQNKKIVGSINVIFCDDKALLEINRRFLNHDYYTDIITFDLTENKRLPIIAELYISTDRVVDNAKAYSVQKSIEIHRVIFHGALHLCGYKDKTEREIKIMRNAEQYYLKEYFG